MFIINELLTTVTYTGNGTQTNFDIPFDYLRKSFVVASINNEATSDFTIDGRTLIFNEAPAEEAIIVIYRKTDTKPLVSWADASVFRSGDMTISQVQQLHIIEEGQDWSRTNSVVLEDDVYNMRFHRVTNVADPVEENDVVTKGYMESVQGGFVQQNTALKDEATKQAGIAATKAGEASTSASAAKTSETNAQKWAEAPDSPDGQDDSESPTGETMSAKEWALYAKQLAIAIGNPVISVEVKDGNIEVTKSNGDKNTIDIAKLPDVIELNTEVTRIDTKVNGVENKVNELENNTKIIYPNNGTAEKPAEVALGTTYIEENPFKGYFVSCIAQVLLDGVWETPSYYTNVNTSNQRESFGVMAFDKDDTIHIRTGLTGLTPSEYYAFGTVNNKYDKDKTLRPCRVLITKLGKRSEAYEMLW